MEKKFKVGDKVQVKETGEIDIIHSIGGGGVGFNSHGVYRYILSKRNDCRYSDDELESSTRTLDDLEVGDVVVYKYGNEASVIDFSKNNKAVYLKGIGMGWAERYWWISIEELKELGYTLKQDPIEETVEVLNKRYKKSDLEKRLKELKEI